MQSRNIPSKATKTSLTNILDAKQANHLYEVLANHIKKLDSLNFIDIDGTVDSARNDFLSQLSLLIEIAEKYNKDKTPENKEHLNQFN